jgi:protein ImuB
VIAEKAQNALRLSAVDKFARSLGLYVGQPLANARAMVPELEVVPANPKADAALLSQLADWCDRFTPVVALAAPDGLILDIAGAVHFFGDEADLLAHICDELLQRKLSVQAAIAGTALAAHALARHRAGLIVPEGREAEAVSPLPIEALQLDAVTTHAFRRAGLKTIGQAASRKRSEIVARFGASTLAVMDEALGLGSGRPINPRKPAPDYWETQGFAEPVVTETVIRAALQEIAQQLCAVMVQEGVGARRLEASFFRADGAIRSIAVESGAPVRHVGVIDRLFHERLAALADPLDPGFGFDLIRLAASRVEKMQAAVIALEEDAQAEAEIAFLVDRLAARFGREQVLRFQPQNTHEPERTWAATPAQEPAISTSTWQIIREDAEAPRRPLRLFTPPEPVTVEEAPPRLLWRKAARGLTRWEGPERLASPWWRLQGPEPNTRDYFRAEDDTGRRYWLFRDLSREPPQWFLHGMFA